MPERRYRCQLERLGAPAWTCRLGLAIVAAAVLCYAAVITVAASPVARSKAWFLPLIWDS